MTNVNIINNTTNKTPDYVPLNEETLNALRNDLNGLQTNVETSGDGSYILKFVKSGTDQELSEAQVETFKSLMQKNSLSPTEKYLLDDAMNKVPETYGAIAHSIYFGKKTTSSENGESVVKYEPMLDNIKDFQAVLENELDARHLVQEKTVQGSMTKQLNFSNFYNSEQNKVEYVRAFNQALDKFLIWKGLSPENAKITRNALVNYWAHQNKSAGSTEQIVFVTEINNPGKYTEYVGQILTGPLSEKGMFGSLYESKYPIVGNPNWWKNIQDKVMDQGLVGATYSTAKDTTLNALGLIMGRKTADGGSRQFTPQQRKEVEGLLGVGLSAAAILILNNKRKAAKFGEYGGKKLSDEEQKKAKSTWRNLLIAAGVLGVGALAYKGMGDNQKPWVVKGVESTLLGKDKTEHLQSAENYTSLQMLGMMANGNGTNSFKVGDMQKYFEPSVEFPGTYGFNLNKFINDYKEKIGPNPNAAQKSYLKTFTDLTQLPAGQTTHLIKTGLQQIGVDIDESEGNVKFNATNLDTPLLNAVNNFGGERDSNNKEKINSSKSALKKYLDGAKKAASADNTYQPGSKEASDNSNFIANTGQLLGWLTQLENGNAIDPKNIFAEQSNFENGKFKKSILIQYLGEYGNLKEWNQLMSSLSPYLTDSRNVAFTTATQSSNQSGQKAA